MNASVANQGRPVSIVDAEAIHHAEMSTAPRPTQLDANSRERGRTANRPSEIPLLGWKDICWRLWEEFNKDRVLLIAAGATFYLLLALFPALAAFVSLYGFVADPATVADHVAFLGGLLPPAASTSSGAAAGACAQNNDALGIGFFVGLAVALWSANSGIKTLFDAMNIAYEEDEKRSFFRLNLMSLAFTMGALLIGIGLFLAVGVVPAVLAFLYLDAWTEILVNLARWPVLMLAILTAISLIYRFGPSREQAKWRWLSWGAVIATLYGWRPPGCSPSIFRISPTTMPPTDRLAPSSA